MDTVETEEGDMQFLLLLLKRAGGLDEVHVEKFAIQRRSPSPLLLLLLL